MFEKISGMIGRNNMNSAKMNSTLPMRKSKSVGDSNNGIHFTIYKATGGKVVEVHTYDPSVDRSDSSLYIITDKDDLGKELELIITKEGLMR